MLHSSQSWRARIVDAVDRIRQLSPYEAVLAYRDLVRMESEYVLPLIAGPIAQAKYKQYLRRFTQSAPGRYFTDHNYARKLVPTIELVRSPGVHTVLDAACGNGFEAVLFALTGKSVAANDISSARAAVAEARRAFYAEVLGSGFDLTVSCGNAVEMTQPQAYDLVFVQEAISHIHPAERFLEVVGRQLLGDDAHLVVCDSNAWNPVTRTRIIRHLWKQHRTLRYFVEEQFEGDTGRRYVMAEERLFSPRSIARAFRAAGLELERIVMSGFVPPQLVRTAGAPAANRIDDWASRVPLLNWIGGFYTAIGRRAGQGSQL